jgi:hypothetical protein
VELEPGTEGKVWTIFVLFKRRRDWGFWVEGKWIEAGEYGRMIDNPVEVYGKDFVIEGTFFPKFRRLNA